MSSKTPKSERIKRGKTESLKDLPPNVRGCLLQLADQFGEVGLWGSYLKGVWAEDSDLDVRVKSPRAWALVPAQLIGDEWGLKIDIFPWAENVDQFIILKGQSHG